MSYSRGPDRCQTQLLPSCVEDFVPPNSPVRFLDAFIEGLDFAELGFTHSQPADTGRPPYHPADLTKLMVYSYTHRIRSSRRQEAEAKRNLELMWLLRGIRPDFKTIADFRKNNLKAFKALFKRFNLLCRELGLFGAELAAIDGSKFKAVNNSRRHYSDEQLKEIVAKIEKRIDEYLSDLEAEDEQNPASPPPTEQELKQKIKELQARKTDYEGWLKEMAQNEQNQKSLTDEDSRKLKGPHGHLIGFNVQVAVDAKHDLIVAEEVVQDANDRNQLAPMAIAAKEELQVTSLKVVADAGYHHADHFEQCEEAGVEAYVPAQGKTGGQSRDGKEVYPKDQFVYNAATNTYCCPAGQTLTQMSQNECRGRQLLHYYNRTACKQCSLRPQCTQSPYRKISRLPNEEVVEQMAQRVKSNPEYVSRRKQIVEHVFGTLRQWEHDTFLMRGLDKVRAEFSISCLVYNLRRVMSLVSLEKLLAAVGASKKMVAVGTN